MAYLGSKQAPGVYQAIIAQMPPHDVYIETHLGSGAIMLRKPAAARSIGIDRDESAIAAFDDGRRDVQLITGRCETVLRSFDYSRAGRVLIYSDPPYIPSTRTSRKRYRFEYDESDHVNLLTMLSAVPAAVILSGYPSALYDSILAGWRTVEFQTMTHGGPRTEKLWINFPAGQVQWAAFAGRNFIARQHIKRKAARWAAKYRAMDQAERLAILSALLAVDGEASSHRASSLSTMAESTIA